MQRSFLPCLCSIILAGCSDMCRNEIVTRAEAPDMRRDAILFERDCGATTTFSTQIAIVPRGEQPSDRATIWVADDDHGTAAAASWGAPWADLRWLSPAHLLVRHDAKARIYEVKERLDGVKISFVPVNREAGFNPVAPNNP